jgi:hypothetical protein
MTVSAILMAMNKLVPEFPIPYPLVIISSNNMVMTEAKVNCKIIRMAFPAPIV